MAALRLDNSLHHRSPDKASFGSTLHAPNQREFFKQHSEPYANKYDTIINIMLNIVLCAVPTTRKFFVFFETFRLARTTFGTPYLVLGMRKSYRSTGHTPPTTYPKHDRSG